MLSGGYSANLFVLAAALLVLFTHFVGLSPFFPFKANLQDDMPLQANSGKLLKTSEKFK